MSVTEAVLPRTRVRSLIEAAESSAASAEALQQLADDPSVEAWSVRAIALELHALTLTIEAAIAPAEPAREHKPEVEEGWYQVELMGHRTRNGYLRCVHFAGRQLVEITEPEHPSEPPKHTGDDDPKLTPARVEFYAPTAIFSLSPSTETDVFKELVEREYIPF